MVGHGLLWTGRWALRYPRDAMTTGDERNNRVLQASIDHLYTKLMHVYADLVMAGIEDSDERSRAKVRIAEEWVETYSAAKAKAAEG
ncbi:MAG: hypothetical protein EOP84_06635 [Verrucomicrobiaceae bacterium]|nr:MAG: hypothetical protein EOP84_06635 [Verrucomicrobiaceae bacterium]